MKHFNVLTAIFFFFFYNSFQSYGQIKGKENIIRIVSAFNSIIADSINGLNKDGVVILAGAESIDQDSFRLEISMIPQGIMYKREYNQVYKFEGFPLLIHEKMDKSYLLKKMFKKNPYVNLNQGNYVVNYSPYVWYVTVNNNTEVVSVESRFRFRDVVRKLKKCKVKLAVNFHFIQNQSWQTDDRDPE